MVTDGRISMASRKASSSTSPKPKSRVSLPSNISRELWQELNRLARVTNCVVMIKGDKVVITAAEGKKNTDTTEFHPRAAYAFLNSRFRASQLAGTAIRMAKRDKETII